MHHCTELPGGLPLHVCLFAKLVAPAGIEPENPAVSRPDITRGGYDLVPGIGFEPTRFWHSDLNAAWLPLHHPGMS